LSSAPAPLTSSERYGALALFALVLAFRLWLSAVFPITGDEAYFIVWGLKPDWGFYDHPPMVGWMHALLTRISTAPWVLRLPSTLLPLAMAAAVHAVLRPRGERTALYAALAFLLVPINVWNVFVTTDTPLVFFSVLSALAWWRAMTRRTLGWYATAGVLLGLAFLSKYFSVLLVLVFVADTLLTPRGVERRRKLAGLAVTLLCATPFGLLNAWWNFENCWANLMFNVYNRHEDAGLSWRTPLLFALIALYVFSPIALVQAARSRQALAARWADPGFRFFAIAAALPMALFAAISIVRPVGLHWVLSFVPFFFIAAGLLLPPERLRASLVYGALFSLLHVALITAAGALPLETWKRTKIYDGIVFHFGIDDIAARMTKLAPGFELAADGYSAAVTLSYYAGRYFFVFGTGSSHARHDDLITDFRALDGRDIAIFRKTAPEPTEYQPYFRSVELRTMPVGGATFHLVLGRGFDYAAYRDRVLTYVRDHFYRIPAYLPQGHCVFCERNFGTYCPAREAS
jgi:hypothetical protein